MATPVMDKVEAEGAPNWLNWGPRKFNELKTFLSEVRTELKKVTWPGRTEVYNTTIVVVLTTVFFGFYLFFLDMLFTQAASRILR